MSESIETRAVAALAAVQKIETHGQEFHPMRHVARQIKQQAEQVLSDAFRTAHALAYAAESLFDDYDKAVGQSQENQK